MAFLISLKSVAWWVLAEARRTQRLSLFVNVVHDFVHGSIPHHERDGILNGNVALNGKGTMNGEWFAMKRVFHTSLVGISMKSANAMSSACNCENKGSAFFISFSTLAESNCAAHDMAKSPVFFKRLSYRARYDRRPDIGHVFRHLLQ